MKKLLYPALFHKAEEGGFWVTFPDFPECMTQGDDIQTAYEMAVDALGLAITSRIEDKEDLPTPSAYTAVSTTKDASCVMIEFDLLTYKRNHK